MNKHLKQLVDLSEIDKIVDSFLPEEERINSAFTALNDEQKKAKAQIEEIEASILENQNKISKNETHLAELSDKLASRSKKGGDLKGEKEIKAFTLEEEITKEQIAHTNDEIARLEKIRESKKDEIKLLKTRIDEIDTLVVEAKKSAEAELAELEKSKKKAYKEKEALVKDVPQKILFFYEKIRRWAGNTAVVPVKKQSCYGCYIKVSNKIYSEVIGSDEIVTCPNCGRILYIESEQTAS